MEYPYYYFMGSFFLASGHYPEGSVGITKEEFDSLHYEQNQNGKQIYCMEDGRPGLRDVVRSPAELIDELKQKLRDTDYRVIKCSEAQLVGETMPYNVAELRKERQDIRDRISSLEQKVL